MIVRVGLVKQGRWLGRVVCEYAAIGGLRLKEFSG